MDKGEVIGLHRVLHRDLPVAVEVGSVAPVAAVGGGKCGGDSIVPVAEPGPQVAPLGGEADEDDLAAGVDGEDLEGGILAIEGLEAAAVGDLVDLSARLVLPPVVLAGELRGVPTRQVGEQAVAVGADVEVGVESTVLAPQQEGAAEEIEGDEVAVVAEVAGQRYRMPGGEEEPVDLGAQHLGGEVVPRLQNVFEPLLVNEHHPSTLLRRRGPINSPGPATRAPGQEGGMRGDEAVSPGSLPDVPDGGPNLSGPLSCSTLDWRFGG